MGTLNALSFDTSIEWHTIFQDGNQEDIKQVTIERNGQPSFMIELTRVLFISDNLHGRGTTVWEGVILKPGTPGKPAEMTEKAKLSERVVVKDSWIDPLWKYMEGMILTILHEKLIEGVPKLIHEQQVKAAHPSSCTNKTIMVNNSTHTICSTVDQYLYHLHVLSRIVTKPIGISITEFSCLGELLVAFLDYCVGECMSFPRDWSLMSESAHFDAVTIADILHHDVSLGNLVISP